MLYKGEAISIPGSVDTLPESTAKVLSTFLLTLLFHNSHFPIFLSTLISPFFKNCPSVQGVGVNLEKINMLKLSAAVRYAYKARA